MGLGKTLQVLATSWTLMQRGGPFGKAAVRKMLVVAPSSVIKNWGNEIHKWLGMERAAYLVLLPGKEATGQVRALLCAPLDQGQRRARVCTVAPCSGLRGITESARKEALGPPCCEP